LSGRQGPRQIRCSDAKPTRTGSDALWPVPLPGGRVVPLRMRADVVGDLTNR